MKKSLRQTLAPMSSKERFQYIWEYYRYWILGVIAIIILISSFTHSMVTKKEPFLNFVVMGEQFNQERVIEATNELNDRLLTEEEKKDYVVQLQTLKSAGDPSDMQIGIDRQKMVAEASASIDFFVITEETFNELNETGQLLAMDDLLNNVGLEYPEEDLFQSPEGKVTGINIRQVPILEGIIFDDNEQIICIPINTKNIEHIEHFFEYTMN